VRNVLEQLDQSGNPVIGAVLNQCNPKINGRPSQPYRGYCRQLRKRALEWNK
jgi:Mrp family chromosome partitioning ATPase